VEVQKYKPACCIWRSECVAVIASIGAFYFSRREVDAIGVVNDNFVDLMRRSI
jgi:hypothetical protein